MGVKFERGAGRRLEPTREGPIANGPLAFISKVGRDTFPRPLPRPDPPRVGAAWLDDGPGAGSWMLTAVNTAL